MPDLMTRNDKLVRSTVDFLKAWLFDTKGLDRNQVVVRDAFRYDDYRREDGQGLDKDYVAMGFNFDDGGTPLEIGGTLIGRQVNIELLVFATTPERGQNLAAHVAMGFEQDPMLLPLKDFSLDGDPVTDYLVIEHAKSQRVPHPDPDPWEENVWQVAVRLYDEYQASASV